jgi:hypothetical protein
MNPEFSYFTQKHEQDVFDSDEIESDMRRVGEKSRRLTRDAECKKNDFADASVDDAEQPIDEAITAASNISAGFSFHECNVCRLLRIFNKYGFEMDERNWERFEFPSIERVIPATREEINKKYVENSYKRIYYWCNKVKIICSDRLAQVARINWFDSFIKNFIVSGEANFLWVQLQADINWSKLIALISDTKKRELFSTLESINFFSCSATEKLLIWEDLSHLYSFTPRKPLLVVGEKSFYPFYDDETEEYVYVSARPCNGCYTGWCTDGTNNCGCDYRYFW